MYKIIFLSLVLLLITSTCNEDDVNVTGMVSGLDCASAVHSGNLISGNVATGVNSSISYSGGNGGAFDGQVVSSTGVTGLVAILNAGNFEDGDGSLTYSIVGVPLGIGTANFPVSIGGRSCILSRAVNPLAGTIGNLNCAGVVNSGVLTAGVAASGVSSIIPYSGGNGGVQNGQSVSSTGVTGLTATLTEGTIANGSGTFSYVITGTPVGTGIANFMLSMGGQSCTLQRTVAPGGSCGAFVASGVWKEFMCHNLGANTNVDPLVPNWEIVGNYYQWGRKPTCFGRDGIDGANPCNSPVHGAAAPWGGTSTSDNAGSITGWNTTDAQTGAWADATKTNNDPCPAGFRVPTRAQWEGVQNAGLNARTFTGTWSNSVTNYNSGIRFGNSLFLPATGYRGWSDGTLSFRGSDGYYWSSTAGSVTRGWNLFFDGTDVSMNNNFFRTHGFSVRCIAE